jgi:SulP family sulfate permease
LVRDDVLIVRFDAQLYFGNANYFKTQLFKLVQDKGATLEAVILNAEAINYIDSTAANMLLRVIEKLYEKGIHFFITGAIGPTRDILFTSGIMEVLPKECLFVETKEAVDFFDDPGRKSQIKSEVAYQRNKVGN